MSNYIVQELGAIWYRKIIKYVVIIFISGMFWDMLPAPIVYLIIEAVKSFLLFERILWKKYCFVVWIKSVFIYGPFIRLNLLLFCYNYLKIKTHVGLFAYRVYEYT